MGNLRLKVCEGDDRAGFVKHHSGLRLKLQECVCYDSDNDHTFWEWRDIEHVDFDAPDFEEQERY